MECVLIHMQKAQVSSTLIPSVSKKFFKQQQQMAVVEQTI